MATAPRGLSCRQMEKEGCSVDALKLVKSMPSGVCAIQAA
jgi:hypothetical protein